MIFNGGQKIDKKDIKSVSLALRNSLITSGPLVSKFEKKIKGYVNSKFALTCTSGTSAIHLAFEAINVSKDDVIIMPSINFISSFNIAKLKRAKIYLTDVDHATGQMTPNNLIECIKKNNLKKIKAVITMYLGGSPENIGKFYLLKKKYNFFWIEDACHAFGSSYFYKKNYKVGSCKHADLSAFSFHPLKTITTGEGGAITTNNKNFYLRMKNFRSQGLQVNKKYHWKYERSGVGLNYRMNEFQSALGISQLSKINYITKERQKIAKNYLKLLQPLSDFIDIPNYDKKNISSWHLFLVSINFSKLKVKKDFLFKYFLKKKIRLQFHYTPIYSFKNAMFLGKMEKKDSKKYSLQTLSIPIHLGINYVQQKFIIKTFKTFFLKYKKN